MSTFNFNLTPLRHAIPSRHLGRYQIIRLYFLVTEAHVSEQLAQSGYLTVERQRPGIEPQSFEFRSLVRVRRRITPASHVS